jgi:geranylgeranyl reductase family protein
VKTDLLIVGAGPAGTAAAITAARAGLDVLVVDKARFPRDKCCGDGLTANALRHLESLGLDPSRVPSWKTVDGVVITSPAGRRRVFPLPRSSGLYAAVARRTELDAALVELAEEAGATVWQSSQLIDLQQNQSDVEASVAGSEESSGYRLVRARFVIGADGMWSTTRKLAGVGPRDYRGDWHAFRQYFVNVSDEAADRLMVWFEPDLLPGYAWSFPLGDGAANVGFGIIRGTGGRRVQRMKTLWPELLRRPHIRSALGESATPEADHKAWPIPARLGELPLALGRILFVGDAAGATDPMSGEGIGQALETGRDAVQAILTQGIDHPTSIRQQYETELLKGMGRDHRLARTLSDLLASPRTAEMALGLTGACDWTRRNFARWLFEDYPRAAALNPHRWRPGSIVTGGAYVG